LGGGKERRGTSEEQEWERGGIPGILKFSSVTPEEMARGAKINLKLKVVVGTKIWREEGEGSTHQKQRRCWLQKKITRYLVVPLPAVSEQPIPV
jgi:hypothetical protein